MQKYNTIYNNSYALCIGIDKYQNVNPLEYARSDAEAISKALLEKYDFKKENIKILLDEEATKENISESYLQFADKDLINIDDRIIVFYAGHGHTLLGSRGNVGYLIPYNGDIDDLSTLLRWDDLTRNSELIPAKHIFFIMDACFSGLAITRSLPQGSMRFIKDMLTRFTRQVLTAGKADEQVADSGGPIPNHSVFTGHLLQALEGRANSTDGSLTANGIMSYVYEKVSNDGHSNQTPHYGFLEGDGDFIFSSEILSPKSEESKVVKDVLVEVPIDFDKKTPEQDKINLLDMTKEYISDERYRIKLDDLLTVELRRVLSFTNEENFPLNDPINSGDDILTRLDKYEKIINNLETMIIPLSYWGSNNYNFLIQKTLSRLTDHISRSNGISIWLELRWYPILLLIYYSGIASMASNRFDNLSIILLTEVNSIYVNNKFQPIILNVCQALSELQRHNTFKRIPQHERLYAPHSEYLFKAVQPPLEDILFLGNTYELLFDKFEILFALIHADLVSQENDKLLWGPFGRFAWKYRNSSSGMYNSIKKEAALQKENWPLLKAGFFNSSYERFNEISTKYEEMIKELKWF